MSFSKIEEKVFKIIEESRDEIVGLTRELVKTPSENNPPNGGELACQKIIYKFFKESGLKTDFISLKILQA